MNNNPSLQTCPRCGQALPSNARFCGNCGATLSGGATPTEAIQIQEKLAKFKHRLTATCPHCQYQGLMGWDDFRFFIPKWLWVTLAVVGIFAGIIPGLIVIGIALATKRYAAECPNCSHSLQLKPKEAKLAEDNAEQTQLATVMISASDDGVSENDGICPFCKEEIRPGAIKCKHCGSDLPHGAATVKVGTRIREALRNYEYVVNTRCLECGYTGPMGLIKQEKPLYQRGWFQFLVLGGFVRTLGGIFLGSWARNKPIKNHVFCPSCRRTLISQGPPAEKSVFMVVSR